MSGSPTIASIFGAQRLFVGVGEMAVSNSDGCIVSTYALGSCVGVAAWDAGLRVGGILHVMLPDASLAPDKAHRQPTMFVDTGLRVFIHALRGLGVERGRLRLMVAGGAAVLNQSDVFKIGERNVQAMKKLLAEISLQVKYEDTGGVNNRTMHLTLRTGEVSIRQPSGSTLYSLA